EELPGATSPAPAASAPGPATADPGWHLAPIDDAARQRIGLEGNAAGVLVTQIARKGPAQEAGLSVGDVSVQVQQERIGEAGDVARVISLARQQQRHYVIILVHNSEGLRWVALSLQ